MIPASNRTLDFHAGYLVLTRAEDEKPVLLHVDDIYQVTFEVDGYQPSTAHVTHRVGDELVEDMVCESMTDIVELIRHAAGELAFLDDGDDF